jgi:leucyl aminopeptidase
MEIEWHIAPLSQWRTDAILFFGFEKSPPLPGFQRWTTAPGGSWVSHSLALADFQGKPLETAIFHGPSDQAVPRLICLGLGAVEEFDMDKLRTAMAFGLRKCREMQLKRLALPLLAFEGLGLEITLALEEALIGGMAGLYRFDALKTRNIEPSACPATLSIMAETEPGELFRGAVLSARALAAGIQLTRDLVLSPANHATPAFLADAAHKLAEDYQFRLKVMSLDEAKTMGMGAFAAVAQGSLEPALLIVLEHAPPGTEQEDPIVFVGKGITFDTGGISLKPRDKMEAMKGDMAGAAAVLGAFETLGRLKHNRRLIGILPCTENMPDGKAYKPGDVIRSLSGLTIEVISTDAEGRMVLCDALTYGLKFRPCLMVDIATLTGASIVALGNRVAAVMGNREDLTRKAQDIGMQLGERLWPLPLWNFYFENLKSDVADFKNTAGRSAGAIIGGIFLKQFVPHDIPWLHLDIAGAAWTEKDLGVAPVGATGFGVRILCDLARRWQEISESLKG